MDLYREPDIIPEIIKGRLQLLRHVEIMPEERTVKKVRNNIPKMKEGHWKATKEMSGGS